MSCKITCLKVADLSVCLVFIRSLSPWYFSSLSENKSGGTGSQGNLERRAVTVIYSNQTWWPRQILRGWRHVSLLPESPGNTTVLPLLPLSSEHTDPAPARPYRSWRSSAAPSAFRWGGQCQSVTGSINTPPHSTCLLQSWIILQAQKGTAKSWNICWKLHDSSWVQEIKQCIGNLKEQSMYGGRHYRAPDI